MAVLVLLVLTNNLLRFVKVLKEFFEFFDLVTRANQKVSVRILSVKTLQNPTLCALIRFSQTTVFEKESVGTS